MCRTKIYSNVGICNMCNVPCVMYVFKIAVYLYIYIYNTHIYRFDEAIEVYHRVLSCTPDSVYVSEMLSQALQDQFVYQSRTSTAGTGSGGSDINASGEAGSGGGSGVYARSQSYAPSYTHTHSHSQPQEYMDQQLLDGEGEEEQCMYEQEEQQQEQEELDRQAGVLNDSNSSGYSVTSGGHSDMNSNNYAYAPGLLHPTHSGENRGGEGYEGEVPYYESEPEDY